MSLTSILIVSLMASTATGVHILLLPFPTNSHIVMFTRLGSALVNQGHSVTLVASTDSKLSIVDERISLLTYKPPHDQGVKPNKDRVNQAFLKQSLATKPWEAILALVETMELITTMAETFCTSMLNDNDLMALLKTKNFDIAIADATPVPSMANVAISLKLDYVLFGIGLSTSLAARSPTLPTFMPSAAPWRFTDEMSLAERLLNTISHLITYNEVINAANRVDISAYTTDSYPKQGDLYNSASFWLVVSERALSYPTPLMPNAIEIGDIMITQSKHLPADFQTFMDAADDGVVLLSLGSYIDYIPDDISGKFCAAFEQIPQRVIWKTKSPPPCTAALGDKLLVVSWTPQSDVLAHPHLKLFITHCGFNSAIEALYNARPMLGFPLSLDQPYNGKLIETYRYGLIMDFGSFTSDELLSNILEITSNSTFQERVEFGSKLIRSKPDDVEERISHWMKHIVTFGSDHLRTGAYKLTIMEFLGVDVWFILFVLTLLMLIIICCTIYYSCKCIRISCCSNKSKNKIE